MCVCFVSRHLSLHLSVLHHVRTNTAPLCPPIGFPCICCFTVVSSTLFALTINCLQLRINKAESNSTSVCLPRSVSAAGGSRGPDSHGAPDAGNPLNLTHSYTNKLPLTTEKHKETHANCLSVHKLYTSFY